MSRIHDGLKRVEPKRVPHNAGSAFERDFSLPAPEQSIALPIADIDSSRSLDPASVLTRTRISAWSPNPNIMLPFNSGEAVAGTEEFRALRSRLYHLREQLSLRRILVSSAIAKEGRSFMAANLAQVMACQHGCRTLLLDADLRSPSLHLALGSSTAPGLSDYLLAEAGDFDIIQRGEIDNLFFVAAGRPVSGQTELLTNGRLKTLLDFVTPLFDWIILDSTAALPFSDAGIIANYCDGALMVVRANSTPFELIGKAREKLRSERILGVVLNEIRVDPSSRSSSRQPVEPSVVQDWKLNRTFQSQESQAREDPQTS